MNITQIEAKLKSLVKDINKETFIYDILLAYNLPKSSITRLQTGSLNLSKEEGEVSWKKKLYYKELHNQDLHLAITQTVKDIKHHQRFVVLTDFDTLVAADTLTDDKLNIKLTDLPKNYDFFLP